MQQILTIVSERYGIGPVSLVQRIEKGFLSRNYELQAGPMRLFLKEYRQEDADDIRQTHRVKQFFAASGIPVILPLSARDGATFITHDGKHYALFPFVDGRAIPRHELTDTARASLGDMLARIHLRGKDGPLSVVARERKGQGAESFIAEAQALLALVEQRAEHDAFDFLAREALSLKIRLAGERAGRAAPAPLVHDHITHGDFHNFNVFFDNADLVIWVFDFEKSERGSRLIELVRALDYSCLDGTYDDASLAYACTMLRAYDARYPVAASDLRTALHTYHLRSIRSLWVEKEHYLKGNTRVDQFLKRAVTALAYVDAHLDDIGDRLAGALSAS